MSQPFASFEPFILRPDHVEQNIRELAWGVLGRADGDARTLLHTLLNRLQPDPYTWTAGSPGPELQFDAHDGLQAAILARIMVVDVLPPDWEFADGARQDCRRRVQRTLGTLEAVDPAMARSVTTVLAALLFGRLRHFGGGSNSSAIGCVWLNPGADWTDIDWLENIFHEYVHHSLFIDDMRHGLFAVDGEVLAGAGGLVRSALLETPRPYDRAFHSCFVSFALMQLDLRVGAAGRIAAHVEPLRVTLAQLREKSWCLTDHGLGVLDSLRAAFAAFQSAHPAETRHC